MGTNIAQLLERNKEVDAIAGTDMFPPRRYLGRTHFVMSKYDDIARISKAIVDFEPDVIINFGVYEPGARLSLIKAREATRATLAGIVSALEVLETKNKSVKIVTRSSVVVYGFEQCQTTRDETTPLSPDTPYGELCRDVEEELTAHSDNVVIVRTAPEIGAHVPHPLARLLLLPVLPLQVRVPFASSVGFPVVSPRDATDIFVRAAMDDSVPRVLHAVSARNAHMEMALKIGNRLPVVSFGIGFAFIKRLTYFAGAPMDPHVEMLIRRGMNVDATATRMSLGITSQDSSTEILTELYEDRQTSFNRSLITELKS